MLIALRAAMHRFVVRQRLAELVYLASDRQLRSALGRRLDGLCRRGVTEGWTARTTAGVAVSLWIWQLSQELEPSRRMRLGKAIVAQERRGLGALEWLGAYESDRLNVVGEDVFLLRFNVASGTLADWIASDEAVHPATRRIFLGMTAWGLAGLPANEVEDRFEQALLELRR